MTVTNVPTHLKHKPVVIIDNYGDVDGRWACDTDARGISLGLAQWNERGRVDASLKVWRNSGDRWSRLSEELPIHRVIDLCILYCSAKQYFDHPRHFPMYYDKKNPLVERIGIQGEDMNVSICTSNDNIDEDVELLLNSISRDEGMISERLRILGAELKELGYGD